MQPDQGGLGVHRFDYKDAQIQLSSYLSATSESHKLLLEKRYFGQALVVMYASMDALGLLLAPVGQNLATGATFRDWVKKCFLPHASAQLDVNEFDLWGARCGVLHTFTSEFDGTKNKEARQVQYFSGDSTSPMGIALSAASKEIEGGTHVMVSIEDLATCFYLSLSDSMLEFTKMCAEDPAHHEKLGNVLQAIRM